MLAAEMFAEAGLPPGCPQRRQRETRSPSTASSNTPKWQPCPSSARRRLPDTSTSRHHGMASAPGALAERRTTWWCCPDADMDLAADSAVNAGYGSAGERCMAISVIVTVGDAADKLIPKIVERAGRLTVGPGNRIGSEMGPLVTGDTGTESPGTSTRRKRGSAPCTGREGPDRGRLRGWLLPRRAPCSTMFGRRWSCTGTRSSDRCCLSCVSTTTRRRSGLVYENQWGNGTAV